MEPDDFWKLQDEIQDMKKDCRETHEEVSKDIGKTIDSIHTLAREVNGKVLAIHTSINNLTLGIERTQGKQKWYVITVLVGVIILILSSFGNFVYNKVEAGKVAVALEKSQVKETNIQNMNSDLEKRLSKFLEGQENGKKK